MGFSAYCVSDAGAKWLAQYYPIMQIVAWTYFCALILCLLFAPWLGGMKRTLQTKKLKIHIARGFFNMGVALCAVLTFSHMPITSAYTIFFLAPLVVTILAIPVYKEHVSLKHWLVIAAGFSGVLIAFPPGPAFFNPWILAAFATMFFVSALNLLARPLDAHETILSLAFYPNLINTLVLVPLTLVDPVIPPLSHLVLFVLTGAMLTLGLVGVASSFRYARHAVAAPLHYSQIVWGVAIGYAVFGDVPDLRTLIGAGIIIASGIYLIESERRSFSQRTD
ncbi:MAG: DMT family transporter [Alphaproteobacteria bacterium]|nr:DMT family transporter [Alphaproteobacteria bacterium]